MEIVQYVAELIQSRKEIGIFGLGTIFKKKSPGRYDTATHSFLPPSYQLAFKKEQTENDALAGYISTQRNISRESADYFISVFVKDIYDQLADQGSADLSPLGKLSAADDMLSLQPNPDFKSGFEFFGLPSVKSTTQQTETANEDATEIKSPAYTNIETVENISEEESLEDLPETDGSDEQPEEITMPDDVLEEVQEPEATPAHHAEAAEDKEINETETEPEVEPHDINRLEQVETPESDILQETEAEISEDQDENNTIPQSEQEEVEEASSSDEISDTEERIPAADETESAEDNTTYTAPEIETVTPDDSDEFEEQEPEEQKLEEEEQIQLENILEEENPGQESHEDIFLTPEAIEAEVENPEVDDAEADEDIQTEDIQETEQIENEDEPVYEEISEVPAAQQPEVIETVIPTAEEPIVIEQEENIVAEELEPIADTRPAAPAFYASTSPTPAESTIQYTIPENANGTGTPTYIKVLIWITSALILAMLAYLIIPMLPESFRKPAISVDSTSKKPVVAKPIVAADTVVEDTVAKILPAPVPAQKAVPVKPSVPVPVKVKTDTVTTYEVIGASVANQKEADQFITQMKKSSITAKVVPNTPGKRLKMSIATFKDEKAARLERARLETKLKIDGIYIYINKPK